MRNYKIEITIGKQDSDKCRKFVTSIEAPSALAAERMANDLVNIKVTPVQVEKEAFDIMGFFKNNVFKISVIIVFFIASGCGREVKVSTPTAVETFEVSTSVGYKIE